MSKKMQYLTAQQLGVNIPGQAEFISAMEKKIGNLLSSKLVGEFKMLVDPNGFHYGFTYGSSGYHNVNSLVDVDRTVTEDSKTNQLVFSQQPFSILYEKVLKNTGYHLSCADQERMNKADIEAQVYTSQLIRAFKNDFPSVPIAPDVSAIASVFQYITATFGSIDQVPIYYTATKNALQDYSANANEAYKMHSMISNAQSRIQSLVNNIDKPSAVNGGIQTDATSYYVGYSLPDFAQTYASLTTDSNKIDILLEFSNFSQTQSQLSIDHEASFIIPLPIFIFGHSESKYTLNSLTTSESYVSMQMSYKGITTFSPNPAMANATASAGWYDEDILQQIKNNTGQDRTGYCLINQEFDVKDLFGANGSLRRLGEFVICQAPTITIKMTAVDVEAVSQCFEHDSYIDIDFFGFGVSSSKHSYKVRDVNIDESSRSATITLGAPKPSATASVETEVAYVLGGVTALAANKALPFSFSVSTDDEQGVNLACKNSLYLQKGSHTVKYYVGNACGLLGINEDLFAALSIWYYYNPDENSIWLSDENDFTSDQTKLLLFNSDGSLYKSISSHTCTDLNLTQKLNDLMNELIQRAEEEGLNVIRRRDIPDEFKELCYHQSEEIYKPLGSTYFGVNDYFNRNTKFVNASGTTGDHFYDKKGKRVYGSWIDLWETMTKLTATNCTSCNLVTQSLCGAHVLLNKSVSDTPKIGENVHIVPLCSSCNHFTKTQQMQAAFSTKSMIMIW